ncbi:helix-turn-helix domain-containing protein [Ralstonia sp. 24A2]|uniref:helix-turn-helix domain-containing protein n=1 Tax=Ralstonia sp. 24A2 TaxID=3447364 RepID=UPI003F6955CA
MNVDPPFGRRLRAVRLSAGLSQEALASLAGLDEFSASARMSQYETGKHQPKYEIADALARALNVPVEYFYASTDQTADMLLLWHALSDRERAQLLKRLKDGDLA